MSRISEYTLEEMIYEDGITLEEIEEDMPDIEAHTHDAPDYVKGNKVLPQWVVAEWERYDNLKDRLEEHNDLLYYTRVLSVPPIHLIKKTAF